jgi:hypothetical protein
LKPCITQEKLNPTKHSLGFKEHSTLNTLVTLVTGLEETHLLYKTMELCAFQTRAEWETQVSICKSLIVRLQEGIPNHLTKKLALFTIKVMVAEEIHMC